ncbi:hypothetical protein C1646_746446 [Rhizophagus diaphanus]|nr:hypothetical protein C1646_746446 [Rhizophagus diaphanus] [Rhizophagus sp. MUCL 43196]
MYHAIFGLRKILTKKQKPYQINLLLELAFKGWSLVKESVKIFFLIAKILKHMRDNNSFTEVFFQNVWKNRGYTTKKKIKKNWQYDLPTIGKIVDEKVLPGWNSACPPKSDKLCDSSEEASVTIIARYFSICLNMKFDDDKDNGEDLEDQASLKDNDDNVVVFADEDINRKLEEALNSLMI